VKAYDTTEKEWRHLNFFQYACYLVVRVPRTDCPDDGILQIDVPWAREGADFTFLFESFAMTLVLVALERSQKWRCCPLVFRRLDKTTPCRRLFKERISHVSQYCETFINVVKIPVVREDSLCIASIGYHLKRSSNAV
jgi:hypothetical protein